ncbi:beta 1-4 rhamnosyltransferase Cps2T [Clostridium perfringens]|uniref:beta 1-4 rhamnosyltransferase Cps2T n=1 Tax=Clostridium perfringens TaxID=1502 RepID=UPI0039EC2ED6
MKNIFIIGSKGIPDNYGGFETFVDKLTSNKKSTNIKYHVSCLSNNFDEFTYNEARCFNVKVPNLGAGKAVLYDIRALKMCLDYIDKNKIKNALIYILACRIGPFLSKYKKRASKLGVKIYVNPDGHEWKRAKWNYLIRKYWKISEKLMVKNADLLICDSKNIEKYIKEDYKKYNPNTTFIAYGAECKKSIIKDNDNKLLDWYKKQNVLPKKYYLIVGRFVPENNYEVVITEFMKSNTNKDLVIVTNVEKNKFYNELLEKTKFNLDKRIKFVGTVYDQEILKKIREDAYGYIHGHEVGGTNPSLLEALASTDLNLLLEVGFNKEVGEDGALYFSKENKNLAELIDSVDYLSEEDIKSLSSKAKARIISSYQWNSIINLYESLFNY